MIRLLALGLALAGLAPQFRTEANAVRIEALVLEDGRPVAGLTAADLVVTDNGRPQTIRVRPLEREPIDVALALDVSDSVRGARLDALRAAALALVGQLTPADRATLLTFDHTLSLGPRDAAPDALAPRLRALTPQGRTSLVDAVTTALVWSTGRERPMLVFVFSDGEDTASWTRPTHALALAAGSDAVVDVIVAGESMPVTTALQASAAAADGLPALPRRAGGDDRRPRPQRRRRRPPRRRLQGVRRAVPRPLRDHLHAERRRARAGTPSTCACPAGAA